MINLPRNYFNTSHIRSPLSVKRNLILFDSFVYFIIDNKSHIRDLHTLVSQLIIFIHSITFIQFTYVHCRHLFIIDVESQGRNFDIEGFLYLPQQFVLN